MSTNDVGSKTAASGVTTAKSPGNSVNDDSGTNPTQIWGSTTTASSVQNPIHYPDAVMYKFDPAQLAQTAYDMTYAQNQLYQYPAYSYTTSDGYTQNYDESYQSGGETLTGYDGSSQYAQYSVPIDQTNYFTATPDGQPYDKKSGSGNLSLFDNTAENYTAHWVSSTTQISSDLKVSPDHPSDPASNSSDFNNVSWNEGQTEGFTNPTVATSVTTSFKPSPTTNQAEALDQQLSQMNLSYPQQYAAYNNYSPNSNPQSQQGTNWSGNYPETDTTSKRTITGTGTNYFNGTNEFIPASSTMKSGAPAQASWAEMVKKNGARPGEVRLQPVTTANNLPTTQQPTNQTGYQNRNQSFSRNNQNSSQQTKYERNIDGQRNYRGNNSGGQKYNQNQGGNLRSLVQQQPTQIMPFIPGGGNYYSGQPQQMNQYGRGNNGYQQRNNFGGNNSGNSRYKQHRQNVGYAGFGNNPRMNSIPTGPNQSQQQSLYGMPTDFNPYVPPPPLLQFGQRPNMIGSQNSGQQGQFPPPYIMFNPNQQLRYFNQQFLIRPGPESLMAPMYNDPYFQMRYRSPFDYDPRYGPLLYGVPRYNKNSRGTNKNGRGGNGRNSNNGNKQGCNSTNASSVSPRTDSNKNDEDKLDTELAESVNRGLEFNFDGQTPEPKGDAIPTDEKIEKPDDFIFPIENLEHEKTIKKEEEFFEKKPE